MLNRDVDKPGQKGFVMALEDERILVADKEGNGRQYKVKAVFKQALAS